VYALPEFSHTFVPAATPGAAAPTGDTSLMRLRWLLERVLASDPWESSPFAGELEAAVRAVAADMRERGHTPEQVIIVLKGATSRSAWRPVTATSIALHYRMTLWSVREFFRCDQR
jgi:hypothetical protein